MLPGGNESFASVLLNKKNKREAACFLKATCVVLKNAKSDANTKFRDNAELREKIHCVDDLMRRLLKYDEKSIDNFSTVEWCKWLIAGGDHPDDFAKKVRAFDDAVLCGLVWTPNFVAYRCRTCGLTPSMSLCADCFLSGNHEGHDFNMFRSQAGGACDCGDVQVMHENGFCLRHGPNAKKVKTKPPDDLVCVAEFVVPHIFRRLLFHFRANFAVKRLDEIFAAAEKFMGLLQMYSDYGVAMKEIICNVLLDQVVYRDLFAENEPSGLHSDLILESNACYGVALRSLENICSKEDAEALDCPFLYPDLNHETCLDEFVFWCVRLEFPQKLVSFLLSFLPCENYKRTLLDSFALHYTRIVELLARTDNTVDLISHRIIHISVQLLSSDTLANDLVKKRKFLRVLIASLYNLLKRCLVECVLHTTKDNFHSVVNCNHKLMDKHNYWVLASDLHNLINHREVALNFMRDPILLDLWCDTILALQGMNVNVRELVGHVEYENRSHYAAFTAEIEISASTTWYLLQHLKDNSTYDCILVMLQNASCKIQDWFESIRFQPNSCWKPPVLECCFHIPLHRLYAAFLCQGIKLGLTIPFPSETFLRQLVMHPLAIQVARSEINCNMWVRNGTSIRYQACLYVQSHFSCAFSDLDIYLLQVCATKINPDWMILTILERFHLVDWLSFSPVQPVKSFLRTEWEMPLLEGALRLLAAMITNTINLGCSEEECTTLEVATLLSQGDKTHSQILELLPDKGSTHSWPQTFEQILHELADYKAPQFEPGGTMSEGIYVPKSIVWERYFDPIFVMMRSFQVKEYQVAMDRYLEYLKKSGKFLGEKSLWPPYRFPSSTSSAYESLKRLLHCRSLHSVIYVILFKAVSDTYPVSEDALSLVVHILELALKLPAQGAAISETSASSRHAVIDLQFCGWFPGNCIFTNLCHRITRILYIDNIPGLSRSCQNQTDQTDFPDLIRLRSKLSGSHVTPTAENSLVPVDMSRSRSADIPYIDSVETENDGEPDYFYNKAMAFLPPGLRRLYFLTSADLPALTMDDDQVTSSSVALMDDSNCQGVAMDYDNNDNQLALQHDQRLAIEGSQAESSSLVLRQPGTVALATEEYTTPDNDTELANALPKAEELGRLPESQRPPQALPQPKVYVTNAGESILSLLIKLHNKLNAKFAYQPPEADNAASRDARVGDGPFFVRKVLDTAYFQSDLCRNSIEELCRASFPSAKSTEKKDSKETKKKAAKDRQERLMAQFVSKQKAVFEQLVQKETAEGAGKNVLEDFGEVQSFECVICNAKSSASSENPIGFVVQTQATSVLGKSSTDLSYGGISEKSDSHDSRDSSEAPSFISRAFCEKSVYEKLALKFDKISSLASTNIGWEGGVYVQTCGHYVHCDCLKAYMSAIQNDPTQLHSSFLQVEKGEFYCPLCRQLANSVLPLFPALKMSGNLILEENSTFDHLCERLTDFLVESEENFSFSATALEKDSNSFVVHLVHTTYPQFTKAVDDVDAVWSFLCSVLRTNLELISLAIQDGGVQKRTICCSELFKLLANQVASLQPSELHNQLEWSRLTGVEFEAHSDVIAKFDNEVPLLFQDPMALLIRLTLILTQNCSDSRLFSVMFCAVFNLHLFQICISEMNKLDVETVERYASGDKVSFESLINVGTISCLWRFVCQQFILDKTNRSEEQTEPKLSSSSEPRHLLSLLDTVMSKFGFDSSARKTSHDSIRHLRLFHANSDEKRKNVQSEMHKDLEPTCNNQSVEAASENTVPQKTRSTEAKSKLSDTEVDPDEPALTAEMPKTINKSDFDDSNREDSSATDSDWNSLENSILHGTLPFLRIAVLLKHFAYAPCMESVGVENLHKTDAGVWSNPFSLIERIDEDFAKNIDERPSLKLRFYSKNASKCLKRWLNDARIVCSHDFNELSQMIFPAIDWIRPKLLSLPDIFDVIFRKFHQMPCKNCGKAPKEMLLCLVCGCTICYKDSCCKSGNLTEIETHTIDCGAGTGIYLSVHSSLVIVVREKRINQWGSLYLDAHGEEDRNLKRGKPLFLSTDRLALLERQWLSHNFDNTCKRWHWLLQNPNIGNVIIL